MFGKSVNWILLSVLIFSAIAISACGTVPEPVRGTPLVMIEQSPNWDYIAYQMEGLPSDPANAQAIGAAILAWEKTHPDRRIVSLQIVTETYRNGYYTRVDGISIYSEPK